MDLVKLENFKRFYGFSLDSIIHLNPSECERIKCTFYSLDNVNSDKELFQRIIKHAAHLSVDAEKIGRAKDDLKLQEIFVSINIIPKPHIYIAWDSFNDVDTMPFDDFCKYFDDIWYPSADDIGVFDDSFSWFVIITHYGEILFVEQHLTSGSTSPERSVICQTLV